MGRLYGRAGRLNTKNGGFRPGQCAQARLGCGWRGARRFLAAHAAGCWYERGRGHLEQMETQLRAQEALNKELAEKAALVDNALHIALAQGLQQLRRELAEEKARAQAELARAMADHLAADHLAVRRAGNATPQPVRPPDLAAAVRSGTAPCGRAQGARLLCSALRLAGGGGGGGTQPEGDHSWVDAFVEEGEAIAAVREMLASGVKVNLLAILGYTILEAEQGLKGFEAAVAAAEAEEEEVLRDTSAFEFIIKVMYTITRTCHQASLCAVRVVTLTRRSSSTRP
jgi:hypothetical protein